MKNMIKKSWLLSCLIFTLFIGCGEIKTGLQAATETKVENSETKKKTVCLNMIVKDETKVITRCLSSVKPLIDYWVIVDTGSTDGTQKMIKEYMKDIPGELHESPWVNFAHNRNEALDFARGKADYILLIDADETLEYPADYQWPPLDKDRYDITMILGNLHYARVELVKSSLDWKWYDVLHEYLHSDQAKTIGELKGITRTSKSDGHRSDDPQKFLKDAAVLEAALLKEPNNQRYRFYLAQSYRDAGKYDLSIENYQKRVDGQGWDQEVFYSLWQIARLQHALDKDPDTITKAYYTAYLYRPSRAEPLCDLAKYYRSQKMYDKAYQIASIGMNIPRPKDVLFVESSPYDYDLELECSVSAYWKGDYETSQRLCKQLLEKQTLPPNVRALVEANLAFSNAKLVENVRGSIEKSNRPNDKNN